MKKIFRAEDASLDDLVGRRTGIIGYGNLGRPFALNLRDSGLDVILSERDSERQALARREGFRPVPLPDLVRSADLIFLLLPDELMQTVFLRDISPWLARGDMLIFASASNIAFGFIEPPPMVDVVLLAPRTLAVAVRERYLAGRGFFSFLAVHQDASGRAWRSLLALARGHRLAASRRGRHRNQFRARGRARPLHAAGRHAGVAIRAADRRPGAH